MLRAYALCLALVLGAIVFGGNAAHADNKSFDLDHMQLALTRSSFFATEGADAPLRWDWRAAATFNFIQSPLVLELPNGGGRQEIIANRSTLELQGAVQFAKWVGLGVGLPIVVHDVGTIDVRHGAGVGDLRLAPRVEMLHKNRFHLAALLELRVPTGQKNRVLGEGMVVFEPRIAFQVKLGMVDFGTNVGVRIREQRSFYDLTVGNELFATLALAVTPKPWISAVFELHGDTAMTGRFANTQDSVVELLFGLFGQYHEVRGGLTAGFGAVEGFGSPRARVMASLEYRRYNPPPPPVEAKPVPRPYVQPPPPEPEPEPEAEPEAAEEPEPEPEVTKEEPAVAVHRGRIELADPIFFAKDRKRVRHRFFPELEQLARVLKRRKELTVIWIEGHADATGPERWNLELSRLRSDAVAQILVAHGVERSRLKPVGFGEARPLVPSPRGESNEKNRRVHFFTDSADDVPVPGGPAVNVPADRPEESP